MSDFDLDALITLARAEGLVDPKEIADHIFPSIPTKEYKPLLQSLLPSLVRQGIRAERARSCGDYPAARTASPAGASRGAGLQALTNNPKVWPLFPSRGWVALADCTVDDLLDVVNGYRARAESNLALAERYERLIVKMKVAGAATVSDLPDDEVWEVFS